MKKCLTFLAIGEMQIKLSLRFHLTPVRIVIIKKTIVGENVEEKGNHIHCLWECKLVQPLWKSAWRFLKKTKNRTTL
jgi:hypothetical protein